MGFARRWFQPDPPADPLTDHVHPDVAAFAALWNTPALRLALAGQPRPRLQSQDCVLIDIDALGDDWPDELSYLRSSLPGWHVDIAGKPRYG